MKLFKKIKYLLPSVFVAAGSLFTSCTDDVIAPGGEANPENGINIAISVSPLSERVMTKANSERTDRSRIEDMNIVLAAGEGDNAVIKGIIYVNKESSNTGITENDNYLTTGSLPFENTAGDGSLIYHVGKESMDGVNQVFVVCNYWQVNRNDGSGEIIENSRDLKNCLNVGTSTVNDLKNLRQGTPRKAGIMTSTLFGEATQSSGNHGHTDGQTYTCTLERTTAMITVAITNAGLNAGVKVTPRSYCLHNVPANCKIGNPNAPIGADENDITWEEGLVQQVGWEPLTSANHGTTVGGHGNDPNIVPVFMFENLQGVMRNGDGTEQKKTPDNGKEKYCSYIEVVADYLYTPQGSGTNQKYISGPIKYRLYLGENITNDFNVHRNKHYQVTLSLKGMGGLVEDGKTDGEGNFIAEGADASWRVESSGVTGGGSFLSDGLNMSSNGFLSYVGFVKEEGHNYLIYCKGGVNEAPWLFSQCTYNGQDMSNMQTPTSEYPAKIYSAEECGGEEGISYVKLYARPWIDDPNIPDERWQNFGGTTIESWIQNGKRTANLILYDATASKEVSSFELRQWLPMPVMVDNSGNPITSGNPNDASFYYSRIDVYEGREIPWAPSYFNNWDSKNLNIGSFTFYNGYPYSGGKPRSYFETYGFDNIIALYGTNPSAFTFKSDYGRPGNAVGVAIFRAGNAFNQASDVVDNNYRELGRIGLPTVAEWEKIIKHGVVDVRFGISNVPYWTSSMSGTQTYTYNPISGAQSLENRNTNHRTRLVYHKNNFAVKK